MITFNHEKTFRDRGSGFVVVKKNNKFREKLFKKTDFPKIKTIPKYLNKSWGKGKFVMPWVLFFIIFYLYIDQVYVY